MPITINALDNEFAASTGSNVNNGPGTSTFDYPPSATSNLTITSNPGDPQPFIFDPGDTYDISWEGLNGGGVIEDAVVIRSDPINVGGDAGHAVVFEGYSGGELVQIVWTPEFDLEQWYFDNFSGGQSPGFYNADVDPNAELTYVCFAAGTRVAVPGGTRRVEQLCPGDTVLTFDNGPQVLRWVGKRTIGGRYAMAPIEFAPLAVGNEATLRLSPQHRVLVRCWRAQAWFGDEELLVPAKAFLGQPGVRRAPVPEITYVHLLFDDHEVLSAEGVGCESLLLGEKTVDMLAGPDDDATREAGMLYPEVLDRRTSDPMVAARKVLRVHEAAVLFNRPTAAPARDGRAALL